MSWFAPEDRKRRRIYVQKRVDVLDESRWPEFNEWLHDCLVRLITVFKPVVAELRDVEYEREDAN